MRQTLGMDNLLLGHALLTDRAGRVRWQAHGFAAPEEPERLVSVAHALLREPPEPAAAPASSG